MPILVELAVPTTVFVVVGAVGKSNFWDEAKGDRHEPTLSLSELRDLAAAGLEIGSHSMTHAWLTDLDNGELQKEVGDSKRALEDMLGKKVAAFSYPYGAWDARVREAVVGAGYGYATTTTLAALTSTTDPFAIPRVNIRWNTFGPLLVRKIARAYRQS
jgi:peptidoglycan/xylan/chitin deacetylase (PgdA/CDA1 family)